MRRIIKKSKVGEKEYDLGKNKFSYGEIMHKSVQNYKIEFDKVQLQDMTR